MSTHDPRGLALGQHTQVAGGSHDQPGEHQARDREAGDVEDPRHPGQQREVERDQADAGLGRPEAPVAEREDAKTWVSR